MSFEDVECILKNTILHLLTESKEEAVMRLIRSCGWYEMIYADSCVRVRVSLCQSVLSPTLLAVTKSNCWGSAPHRPLVEYPWQEAEVLSEVLKINTMWYGQKKKKLLVNIAVCLVYLRLSVVHATEASTPFKNKVWELYSYKEVLWPFFLNVYSSIMTI